MNAFMLWAVMGWLFVTPVKDSPVSVEKWVSYSSAEGKVKMKFPGEYTIEEDQKDTHKVVKISSVRDEENFFLSYTVHQMPMSDHYEMAQISLDSFSDAFGVEAENEEDFIYKSYRGRQATLNLDDKGMVITYKALLVGQIQYQIVVVQAQGADPTDKDKFLKSFKLLK